jgi:type I restriction enzyme S subunit
MTSENGYTQLADVCEFISRGITPAYVDEDGIQVINQKCIRNGSIDLKQARRTDPQKKRITKEKFVKKFDILVNSTGVGTLGRVGQIFEIDRELTVDTHVTIVRPNTNEVHPIYLGYVVKSLQSNIEELAEGSTGQTELSRHKLGALVFKTLERCEQKEIGEICKNIDDRISILQETNVTLEAIAQALFKSWFVDFDPVRAKSEGKLPEGMDEATAALFPDAFEETEVGMVPRGWKNSNLSNVSDIGIGKTPPRKEAHWFSEDLKDVRWVSIRDMGTSGAYISNTSEFLTTDAVDKFNVRRVPSNTVLLSFKMTIGRVAITDGEMTTNEAIAHCKLTSESPLPSEYIYLHLKGFDYNSLSSTSSIADAVNSKTVKAIPILVPNAEVVAAFKKITDALFEKIKNTHYQSQTLTTLRDTLMPRLISGQLRIADAEAELEKVTA